MERREYKSESYIVREAENIINNYIEKRDILNANNYYNLQKKYERLKIMFGSLIITVCFGLLLLIVF